MTAPSLDDIRHDIDAVDDEKLALQEPVKVAFLGPAGTFTHAAARELFGLGARYSEAATIAGVFDAVSRGEAAYGVVPIENSTDGSVTGAVDALIESDVMIHHELVLEVSHCLMSVAPGLTAVERVYSHPQALAQCRVWLAKNLAGAQLVQAPSTAAAARDALADPTSAAIGSRLAAELYGLPVLRDQVQDLANNATRFVMLARADASRTGHDRTTVVFAVNDGRGALRRVLEVFDDHDINLTRIESRPSRQRAWDYVFLTDLDGHRADANVGDALSTLERMCPMVRCVGSYPRSSAGHGHCPSRLLTSLGERPLNRDPLDDPDAKKDPAAAPPEPSEGETGQQSGRPQPEQDRRERTEQHVSGYGGAKGEPKDGGRTG